MRQPAEYLENRPNIEEPCEIPKSSAISFIIKIWLEETTKEMKNGTWRGHITHVPSMKRKYIKGLMDIPEFILYFIKDMGANPGLFWRIWSFFKKIFHSNR